jgi:hypothetical protein
MAFTGRSKVITAVIAVGLAVVVAVVVWLNRPSPSGRQPAAQQQTVQPANRTAQLAAKYGKAAVPGPQDVSMREGSVYVSPNFADYRCQRPCSLPLSYAVSQSDQAEPRLVVTRIGPCEFYDPRAYTSDRPYCASKLNPGGPAVSGETDQPGDKLRVVCQKTGGWRNADSGQPSNKWLKLEVPAAWIQYHREKLLPAGPKTVYAYAPNRFLGNQNLTNVRTC